MTNFLSEVVIWPFIFTDVPAITTLRNVHFPDDPVSVEDQEYDEQHRDPRRPFHQLVAELHGQFVGYSSIWLPKQSLPVTIMTGVAPLERRHGVALAIKLLTIRIARAYGYGAMRTTNDTANPAILAFNERLGYQPLPAWLVWEKHLRAD